MEKFRSMSVREGRLRMDSYSGGQPSAPTSMHDLRSYSYSTTSYASSSAKVSADYTADHQKELKIKKSKSKSASKSWILNDPELQRKKRVAGYKVYAVEGKMKSSFRKSFRWIKDTCTQVVWW